jgi:hypothetical protein
MSKEQRANKLLIRYQSELNLDICEKLELAKSLLEQTRSSNMGSDELLTESFRLDSASKLLAETGLRVGQISESFRTLGSLKE